MVPVICGGD